MGTIVNCAAIILGGIIGVLGGSHLPKRYQETLMTANGVAVLFIGISGVLQRMLVVKDGQISTQGTMMMILSLAFGAVIGEWWNLDHRMEQFGVWLKLKSGNAKDTRFVTAFVTASLTVCIGAMAVIGAIQDGIYGDHSILFAKAVLDFVIVLVMSAALGKGCIFSFIPVGILQGTITVLASAAAPYITDAAMANLGLVGNVLIFCVGLNLVWGQKVRVANLLPALIIAVIFAYLPWNL